MYIVVSSCEIKTFVETACGERNIVTISVRCMCVCCACVHPSGFVRAITSTFMHGFQKIIFGTVVLLDK